MVQITSTTFEFLSDLKLNNNKSWFDQNKKRYEAAHQEMISFTEELIETMSAYDVIEKRTGKKSLYRIYRDIRFSKDKTPYKTHWAGSLKRSGAKRRGGMYFHITPENTHIAGGFWGPNKDDLLLLRQQIAMDAEPLREVLESEGFKQFFGQMSGEQVKTAPKGFAKDQENIELIRFKQFLISHSFSDQEVLSADFVEVMASGFAQMMPFFDVMTMYLTTNLNGESML